MSKADVLTLVTEFSNSQADTTAIDQYYDHLMEQLAREVILVNASVVELVAGTSQYTLTTTQAKLLAVFYDERQLDLMDLRMLEGRNPHWRDERGTPFAYVVEHELAKTYRLYPTPTMPSTPLTFTFGEPVGRDYPTYGVAIVHTEIRSTLPAWLELPVAFMILAREYHRESNHRDPAFADACAQFSQFLMGLVR